MNAPSLSSRHSGGAGFHPPRRHQASAIWSTEKLFGIVPARLRKAARRVRATLALESSSLLMVAATMLSAGLLIIGPSVTGTLQAQARTFSIDSPSVMEGDSGSMDITFTLRFEWDAGSQNTSNSINWRLETIGQNAGTATHGSPGDFTGAASGSWSSPISISEAGESSQRIRFTIRGDRFVEPDETIVVQLHSNSQGTEIETGQDTGTGTIENDDTFKTVSVVSSGDVQEGAEGTSQADVVAFSIRLSDAATADVLVDYVMGGTATGQHGSTTLANADYIRINEPFSSGIFTIPMGQTFLKVPVSVVGDGNDELDETITLTISNPRYMDNKRPDLNLSGENMAEFTIVDDDVANTPVIRVQRLSEQEHNTAHDIVVTLSQVATQEVMVDWVISGTATGQIGSTPVVDADYTMSESMGTLTIPVGDQSAVLGRIQMVEDEAPESTETVVVILSNAVNAELVETEFTALEILNEDNIVSWGADPGNRRRTSISEGDTGTNDIDANHELDNRGIDLPVSVRYRTIPLTATPGEDYVEITDGTTTCRPFFDFGSNVQNNNAGYSCDVPLQIIGDTKVEPDETFIIELFGAENAQIVESREIVYITNDDGRILYIEPPEDVIEAARIDRQNNRLVPRTMTFKVWLSPAPDIGEEVTATFSLGGTAVEGEDFPEISSKTVSFEEGEISKFISFRITDDDVHESNESVSITLSNPSGAVIVDGRGTAVAQILNDDDSPEFSIDSPSIAEGALGQTSPLEFAVTKTGSTEIQTSVQYTFVSGSSTAISGSDFEELVDGTLTFEPTETTKMIRVMVTGDILFEENETLSLMLFNPIDATIRQGEGTGTGIITNDDVSNPSFTVNRPTVVEGGAGTSTTLDFVVTLTPAWNEDVTVKYEIMAGTGPDGATPGEDFAAEEGDLTFMAGPGMTLGENEKTVSVTVNGDDFDEADEETVTLRLFEASSNAQIDVASWTGAITDDDSLPVFAIDSQEVNEGDSGIVDLVFTVTKTGATRRTTMVTYTVADGTATGGTVDDDYLTPDPLEDVLEFAPDENEKTITIQVNGDLVQEPDEAMMVTLSHPVSAALNPDHTVGTGTIRDNDDVTFTVASEAVDEGDMGTTATLNFVVTMSRSWHEDVTVEYEVTGGTTEGTATLNEDFQPAMDTLIFEAANAETEKTVSVTIIGDDIDEVDEMLTFTLSNQSSNARISQAVWSSTIIDDDDLPVFSIDSPDVDEGDTGTVDLVFTVTKTGSTRRVTTVMFTVADGSATGGTGGNADYLPVQGSQTLTFQSGDTKMQVTVQVNGDEAPEENETIIVTLSNPNLATLDSDRLTGTGTIFDDDRLTFTVSSTPVEEGNMGTTAMLVFVVEKSHVLNQQVTVGYTVLSGNDPGEATVDEDFEETSGILTFAPSDMMQTVSVTVIGDDFDEADEDVTLTLRNSSDNILIVQADWTSTILDDDDFPVFSINEPRITEGTTGTTPLPFIVTKTGGTRRETSVTFSLSDGTASGGETGNDTDYEPLDDIVLTFAPDEIEKTVDVQINGDDFAESDETVTVTLSNPMLATLLGGEMTLATSGTIINDDFLIISIDSPRDYEGDSTPGAAVSTKPLTFIVTMEGGQSDEDITVDYQVITDPNDARVGTATFGASGAADYTTDQPEGTLTFSASEETPRDEVVIMIRGDSVAEADETVVVRLHNISPPGRAMFVGDPTPDEIYGTGEILTDDSPTFRVRAPENFIEGDTGSSLMTFEVIMSQAWTEDVTIEYTITESSAENTATAGVDFREDSGQLTFDSALGETEKEVSVEVFGDLEIETDENLTLTLSNPNPNNGAVVTQADWTGVILSDEYALSVADVEPVAEPVSGETASIEFVVTLEGTWSRPVELEYVLAGTATARADYTDASATPGQLVIPENKLSGMVSLSVNADIVDEDSETVTIEIFNLAGTSLSDSAEATISKPGSDTGDPIVPDAKIVADSLQAMESGGVTTARIGVSVMDDRSFDIAFDWRVTRFVEAAGSDQVSARNMGDVVSRATVEVLADSTDENNDKGSVLAAATSSTMEATLSEPVSPGDVLGFEIFNLDCGTSVCGVVQSERAQNRANQLSEGRMPETTVLAEIFEVNEESRQIDALSHALAGFGRAVATGIVNGVWRRADAHRSGDFSSSASLGGRSLDTAVVASGNAGRAAQEVAELITGAEFALPPHLSADADFTISESASGNLDDWFDRTGLRYDEDLTENSRFSLSLDADSPDQFLTVWGEGAVSSFGFEPEDGDTVDGGATVMLAGVDWTNGDLLIGVAMTMSQGDSDYSVNRPGSLPQRGSLATSLTGVAPYLHWLGVEGVGIWGSVGVGSGDMELMNEDGVTETGIGMTMLAAGAKRSLSEMGYDKLALRGDLFVAQVSADAADDLEKVDAGATRLRLAVERVAQHGLDGEGNLFSHLELGARLDSGDGGSGAGVDAAGELRYDMPDLGLEVAGRAGMALLHGQSGFSEWSAGVEAAYSPGIGGRGLQLSIEPRWNVARVDIQDSLWNGAVPGVETGDSVESDIGASAVARLGYGVDAMHGKVLTTPYGEAETGDGEKRLRLGVEVGDLIGFRSRYQLEMHGERRESGQAEAERRAMIEGRLSF